MKSNYHRPVLLQEAADGLNVIRGGLYVDATFGGGGHSRAILERLGDGQLVAFDQDNDAEGNVPDDDRILFLNHNFRYMKNFLKWHGKLPADGILADLGVSSHQFDKASRGFSSRFDGPLDMRMNTLSATTAKEVLNRYDEKKLAGMFRMYGELKNSHKIAASIVGHRKENMLETTSQLAALLKPLAPKGRENKFLAQVFQALRIEINAEMESLRQLLIQSPAILKDGGRLVIISYHSLEDRMVKNYMKSGNVEGKQTKDFYGKLLRPFNPVSRLQTASEAEIRENPRARSARLRIAEKNKCPDDTKRV